jgi:TonB-linked SusC/RagA family outer membrane protein
MKCLPLERGSLHPSLASMHRWLRLSFYSFFIILFLSFTAHSQQVITGKVSSGDSALAEVSVQVKGATSGTITDAQGKFSINAPANGTLIFSHVNFGAKQVAVNGRTTINVELTPIEGTLTDVVVVGYNSQRKATLTGSISQVKGADLVKSPQANLSNSLAGRFSGMVINNRSGEPGYDGSGILIRGFGTLKSNSVLVVVDGVPGQIGGLERLNPNDIESISVLKDASAAIYGNRAANGVILVTTKRGKTGKPTISASFNQGFSSPTRLPKMADAATYATIVNEVAYYNNQAGGMNQQYSAAEIQKFADGSDPLNYPNTDWQKVSLKNTALQNQANVSISGGSENVKYFLSGGSFYQDGIYKNGVTKYKQYSFRSNIDANITKDFKVSLYLSGREEDRQFPQASAGSVFRSIYRAYATLPAFYPNGLPSRGIEGSNPAVMSTDIGGVNRNPGQVFNGILKGSYNIAAVKGLSIDGFAAVDKSAFFTKSFSKPYLLYSYDKNTNSYSSSIVGGSNNLATLWEGQDNRTQITSNIKLNYQRNFGQHQIMSFVGYEQSESKWENFNASRQNFPTTQTPELSQGGSAATDKDNGGSSYHFTRNSFIGKIGYNYLDKYMAEVQMRVDGTSNFPEAKRYGYFPSVSAGWRISKESFFNVPFISDLKLRASYGTLGNDDIANFQYFNNYSFNNQLVLGSSVVPGIDLTKLANPVVHWEVAKKMDVGLEATFLQNFSLELIYFKQDRSNILWTRNASIPFVSGIVNPYGGSLVPDENIGKLNSNGIEATLGYNNRSGAFTYGISGNVTYAKSEIVNIDEAASVLAYQKQTAGPMNTYLLYNSIGIFRSQEDINKYPHLSGAKPGDLIYEDYNKDGKITADDQVRTQYGNIPQITYGVLLNAGYKNFDLSAVFAGQEKVRQYVLPESGTIGNFYSSWADNRWSPTNTSGTYPRVDTRTSSSVNGGLYNSTFWLQDAAFVRLKNLELGYNLSPDLLTRIKMQSIRLYVNAFNLFTITKLKDVDPEGNSGSGQFYPQQRIINVGVNVRF